MADKNDLLSEAEKLGILNIDSGSDHLYPEAIQVAIEATGSLNSKLKKEVIAKKLQGVDRFESARHR